jgi:hypothetical protein
VTTQSNSALYLVATDDGSDPDYTATRNAGFKLAEQDGATVLLFDRTSESLLTDPYPVGPWSEEDDAVSEDTELDVQMLENLGRHYLIEQMKEGEQRGLNMRVHLARGAAVEAFKDAAERYNPDLLVIPAAIGDPSLKDKVKGESLKKLQKEVNVDIRLVSSDGDIQSA